MIVFSRLCDADANDRLFDERRVRQFNSKSAEIFSKIVSQRVAAGVKIRTRDQRR